MKFPFIIFFWLFLVLQVIQAKPAQAKPAPAKPVDIVIWHSLAEQLGNQLKAITTEFNKQNPDYNIRLIYKGDYAESLTNFAAAFRAKQAPALIHVFEVGTRSVVQPNGIIKPVNQLMQEENIPLPTGDFLAAIRSFYSQDQKLLAMPLNVSIPVMYYNVDALEKVGYKSMPGTWQEIELLIEKLKKAGYPCGYTTAYPSWIHVESFAAIHGLSLFDSKLPIATYNNQAMTSHLERLRIWQKKHYFEYGGRTSGATILFTSGRCPLFSQSSGSYNSLASIVQFKLGVAAMPLDPKVSAVRHNNLIGGGALWIVSGHPATVYQGIAKFFSYLTQPHIQQRWYENTGYLPLGLTGMYESLEKNETHPILQLAKFDLRRQEVSEKQDVGPQNLIRAINDEALEAIFSGMQTVKEAMDQAVEAANYSLMRFTRNTTSSISTNNQTKNA